MRSIDELGNILLTQARRAASKGSDWAPKKRLLVTVLVVFGILSVLYFIIDLSVMNDYVGGDNDDAMRLVEVRDFLAGQGWFDLMQYRLGPAPGTLMHWSRLIDLPIALLISFFKLFVSQKTAEMVALYIWPVSLTFPLLYFTGLGALRLGGEKAMYAAVALAAVFSISVHKYSPGEIDHHNAQLVLVAIVAAALTDPGHRAGNYVLAGLASAVALAVGVETTPLMAVAAVVIALRWAFLGAEFNEAAKAYGLSFGLFTAAAFFATVPPHFYTKVTCDTLSFGFFSLTAFGGIALFAAASLFARSSLPARLAVLGVVGAVAAVMAVVVMPQCLQNPYDSLDPLLRDVWLDHVQETQPIWKQIFIAPSTVGGFYFPGFIGLAVCLWRIRAGAGRSGVYAVLAAVLGVSVAISAYQLRGAMFAQLLSILPLSVLIADLHGYARRRPDSEVAALPFAIVTVASVPAFWFIAGIAIAMVFDSGAPRKVSSTPEACRLEKSLVALNDLPTGMIAAPSNMGSPILRFTGHSVLSAPYHRDQAGLLAVIRAGLAKPADAERILGDAGTDYFVYCPGDGEIAQLARRAPDGFFAEIAKGQVPSFLKEVPLSASGIRAFKMVR